MTWVQPMTHRRNSTIFFLQCIRKDLLVELLEEQLNLQANCLGLISWCRTGGKKRGEKERKMTPMLRPAWSMMLLHFRVDLSLRIYETSITRIRALEDYYVLSKVNTLNGCRPFSKGKPPKLQHGWMNISSSPGYSHNDWVGHRW